MAPSKPSSSLKSQQTTIASMTLFEKLDTIPGVVSVLVRVVLSLFTGPFIRKENKAKTYYRHVILTALRTFTKRMNVKQQHYLNPPTDKTYAEFCKKYNQKPQSEVLEDGTLAHWIGQPGSDKLILNFHGGGYTLPPTPGMFVFINQILQSLRAKSPSQTFSSLFLSYDLAPTAPYPRQLQQASSLLLHVLNNLHYTPSQILISGDSAGANLAMALLSHITHPHPGTTLPIPKIPWSKEEGVGEGKYEDGRFAGVVLTSPWASFEMDSDSFKNNEGKDVVSIKAGTQWSSAFLSGTPWPHTAFIDPYNQPGGTSVSSSWFTDFPSIVDEILIVAGSDEVMIDGIKSFRKKLSQGMGTKGDGSERVRFLVGEGEYHDMPSLDLGIGFKESEEGMQAREIKRWVATKML